MPLGPILLALPTQALPAHSPGDLNMRIEILSHPQSLPLLNLGSPDLEARVDAPPPPIDLPPVKLGARDVGSASEPQV